MSFNTDSHRSGLTAIQAVFVLLLAATSTAQPQPEATAPLRSPNPQARRPPAILMISLDDPEQPYIQPIIQGFRERLTGAPGAPTLDVEFFDQVRFGDRQAYADEFIEWLHRKYSRDRLDLIVAMQQQTLQLLAKRPGSPWNDLPVVYGSRLKEQDMILRLAGRSVEPTRTPRASGPSGADQRHRRRRDATNWRAAMRPLVLFQG